VNFLNIGPMEKNETLKINLTPAPPSNLDESFRVDSIYDGDIFKKLGMINTQRYDR